MTKSSVVRATIDFTLLLSAGLVRRRLTAGVLA